MIDRVIIIALVISYLYDKFVDVKRKYLELKKLELDIKKLENELKK